MTKSILSGRTATWTSMSKAGADAPVSAVFSTITNALAGGQTISIVGFRTLDTYAQGNQT